MPTLTMVNYLPQTVNGIFSRGNLDAPSVKLGAVIRGLRQERRISQTAMAGKLDVSRQQYASYERGDTEISPSRLGQIAKELQVPTSEIVRRAETPPAAAPTREWSTIYKPFEVRQKLPPRAYERVYGYLERLQAADIPLDMIEEVERLMVDPLYSKINKREIRERSEEDLIIDIDAAWLWVKEIVEREWGKSLK